MHHGVHVRPATGVECYLPTHSCLIQQILMFGTRLVAVNEIHSHLTLMGWARFLKNGRHLVFATVNIVFCRLVAHGITTIPIPFFHAQLKKLCHVVRITKVTNMWLLFVIYYL